MKIIYTSVILSLLLYACSTSVRYIGSGKNPTTEVEVFTNRESIQAPFTEIGRGFIKFGYTGTRNIEKIQQKIIEVAKKKGANAVLIEFYYIPDTGMIINNISRTDSMGKTDVTTGTSSISQTGLRDFTILFLKYR